MAPKTVRGGTKGGGGGGAPNSGVLDPGIGGFAPAGLSPPPGAHPGRRFLVPGPCS
eukprot:COSAG01_NODE_36_length_34092_cov_26.350032_1_plen_55_part_10